MKHSLRFKITFLLTTMIIMIVFITWFINRTFLSNYYIYTKMNTLNKVYQEIETIYDKVDETENLSEEDTIRMEKLASDYNLDIYVITSNLTISYPTSDNVGKREYEFLYKRIMEYLLPGSNPYIVNMKLLKDTSDFSIFSLYDQQMDSSYIDLVGSFTSSDATDNSSDESIQKSEGNQTEGNTDSNIDNNADSSADSSADSNVDSNADSNVDGNADSNVDSNTDSNVDNNTDSNVDSNTDSSADSSANGSIDSNSAENKNFNDTAEDNEYNFNSDSGNEAPNTKNGDANIMMVLLRANLESIEEGVAIANTFLMYVGILAALFGSIAMFLLSRNFTKPILELAGIAKKMSDLNFEIKYKVKSKDEIGKLGSSINTLSNKLESTIMELKQANNELITDIQKKTEIDEMRKEFLSNVSHELKTPISLIQGYAEGLKENINEDPESRDFYCEVIMDEADKMNKMVKKLLNLNEIEFGNSQVNFERFDIVALIQSVLGATEILFKQKEVTLYFNQTEPVYVWADEYMVEQVVTNYISNALNHVSDQKIIEIKLIPREGKVRVAVFNTGDNIPEEDIDKIWIKFYKVDKARTREYGGSGIGLSIVKAIMNSLNQEFGAINRPIGVEFWFELDTTNT